MSFESVSVAMVTSVVLAGEKVTPLLNVVVPLTATVSAAASPNVILPFAVNAPAAVKALLTVVVPDPAPSEIAVAAPADVKGCCCCVKE